MPETTMTWQVRAAAPVPMPGKSPRQENLKRAFLFWLVFSAGLLWLGPFSNYSPPGFLDPWIYTGYFTNFHYLVNRFGLVYYPSRLPYVMFGVLMYKMFSPLAANYLINVIILSADAFSLYAILLRHDGRWIAAVSTFALACNPYLIGTIAWDYPDGPAIAFLLLGFWMILAPPHRLKSSLATILAGALWAMAGYTNLIAGLIIIAGVVTMLYAKWVNFREAVKQCAWLATGVAVITMIFGSISLAVFHTFAFWMPQWILYRANTTTGALSRMWGAGLDWIPINPRLAAPYGLAVIGLILFFWRVRQLKQNRFFQMALLLLLLSDATFAYSEFVKKAVVLKVYYTSSYLVVPTFVFVGALLSALRQIGNQSGAWFRAALVGSVLAGTLLPFAGIRFVLSKMSAVRGWDWVTAYRPLAPHYWTAVLVFLLLGVAAVSLPESFRGRGFVIAIAAFCFSVIPSFSTTVNFPYVFRNGGRTEFKAAMATQDILTSGIVKERPLLFWYDDDERWSSLYDSINSLYLWIYRDFTHQLPTMPVEDLRSLVRPDTVVIHITTAPAKMAERGRLLATRNIRVEDVGHWKVQRGQIEFEVYAQHVLNASEIK